MKQKLSHPISLAVAPIILGMCHFPEQCEIVEEMDTTEADGSWFLLQVNPSVNDYGIILGKDRRQLLALRYVVDRMGDLRGIDATAELVEGLKGKRNQPPQFQHNPEFDVEAFLEVLGRLADEAIGHGQYVARSDRSAADRLKVYLAADSDHVSTIRAIGDLCYPYGFRQGMIIEVKPERRVETVKQ